jgi:2,4-dienoyl-CoA reductase-like NADH-dependent reductase (Old Yellow Enzyme family)
MATLFEETSINGMTLKNRIVRSATWEGMAEPDGRPTARMVDLYRELAAGGVGLIISGFAFVQPDGKALPGQMGIHSDDFAAEYKAITDAVHAAGGKIVVQLVHAGGQTMSDTIGQKPLAPSAVEVDQFQEKPAELTKEQIAQIRAAFGEGARRAKAWGFDGVQFHGAHGYLINQFLSPLTNQRLDEYGGSIEKRIRFLMEVYRAVRSQVGTDFPVMIKLNASDNLKGGLASRDADYAARRLSQAGIDAVEVSAGTPASGKKNPARQKIINPAKEAYNLDLARMIKGAVSCPVMVVGGYRSFEVAAKTVTEEFMDYVAMARPLINEPGLPARWESGDHYQAGCISCNGCFGPGLQEGGIYCVVKKREQEKAAKAE